MKKLSDEIRNDWSCLRLQMDGLWRYYLYLFFFSFIYGIVLSLFIHGLNFFLALFRLHYSGLLRDFWSLLNLLIVWAFFQVTLFFIINPLLLRSLLPKKESGDYAKKLALCFLSLFLVFFFVWTPVLLPLCLVLILASTHYTLPESSFSFSGFLNNWKEVLKEGCLSLWPFLLPFLGLLFLPRVFKRMSEKRAS